jgi:hypothetical protein
MNRIKELVGWRCNELGLINPAQLASTRSSLSVNPVHFPFIPFILSNSLPVKKAKSRICIRLSVVMRFIRLHPGAQKGNAANYLIAVRTALQAKPLY